MKHQDALDQLARETRRARSRMAWERGLRAGFALLAGVGVWALVALAGLHERLPLLAQSLSAIAALITFALLGLRARRAYVSPSETEARQRLAADSQLDLAAFDALKDRPSRYDAASVALWAREREHALQRAGSARAGPARPKLDDVDPYKLRYVLAALLAAGLVFANADAPRRWRRGLCSPMPTRRAAWRSPSCPIPAR